MDEQEKQAKIDELLVKIEASEKANGKLPEAGGIAFTTLYTRRGAPVNVTERGASSQKALAGLVHTIEWAYLALDMTTSKPEPPAAQPPKEPADQRIAREVGNAPLAEALKAQTEAIPDPPAGKTWLTLDAKIVKVLPQPDNKVTIEFYSDGHKYPDVKVVKWKLDAAAGLLKHITAEPADKAGEYSLPCRVYYTEGKEYTTPSGTTGHYKDVAHVRPL